MLISIGSRKIHGTFFCGAFFGVRKSFALFCKKPLTNGAGCGIIIGQNKEECTPFSPGDSVAAVNRLPPDGRKLGAEILLRIFLILLEVSAISAKDTTQVNDDIRVKEVRVIGSDGEQIGILKTDEAREIAYEKGMDLVLISPQAEPPVCRIMDYGKYRFEQTKKEKEARKNQRIIEIKEIRMSPGIGENDFNTKLKNGQKFLLDGDRLKVTVRFRGREMAHTNIGEQLLTNFAAQCAEIATMDKNPKMEGRNMFMFLSPKAPDKQANKK